MIHGLLQVDGASAVISEVSLYTFPKYDELLIFYRIACISTRAGAFCPTLLIIVYLWIENHITFCDTTQNADNVNRAGSRTG